MKLQNYLLALIFILSTQLYAHCQIPCGVYDDTMRIKMIEEHTLTILKSMNYIEAISKRFKKPKSSYKMDYK